MKLFKFVFLMSIFLLNRANAETILNPVQSINVGDYHLKIILNVGQVIEEARHSSIQNKTPLQDRVDRILTKIPAGIFPYVTLSYTDTQSGRLVRQIMGLSMRSIKLLVRENQRLGGIPIQEIKISIPVAGLDSADITKITEAARGSASTAAGGWKGQALMQIVGVGLSLLSTDFAKPNEPSAAISSSFIKLSDNSLNNSSPNTALYQRAIKKIPFKELVGVAGPDLEKIETNSVAQ